MDQKELEELRSEGFNSMQIQIIRKGEEMGIDTSPIKNVQYTWEQMEEILEGIKSGIDITVYAIPDMDAEYMRHIREKMIFESGELDIKEQELAHKRLVNLSIFLGIAGGIAIVSFLLFLFKDTLALAFVNLDLSLKEDEVTLEYQTPFNAADYLENYTDGKNVRVILPENIDTSVLGSQTAVYKVTNGIRSASKSMLINVVDTEAPQLQFTESKVTINAGDTFRGKEYIESATDNYDGDLIDSVICSTLDPDLEKQKIRYEVADSSGNKTEETLLVLIAPLLEEAREAEETNESDETISEEKPAEVKPAATPVPTPAPAQPQQPAVQYEEYDETYSYEENGGVTTCTVHHNANGTKSQSCEWIGPWEEY